MPGVTVHLGRYNALMVDLPYNLDDMVFTSQIRTARNPESDLIAEWSIETKTDSKGRTRGLLLTLDVPVTSNIQERVGWMDLKRVSNGDPIAVFEDPVMVTFKNVVTE